MRNENFLPVIFSEASVRETNRPVRGIGPRAFAAVRHGIRLGGACRLSLRSFPKRTVASAAGECTKGRGATGGERTGTAAAGRHCRCGSGGETAARNENSRTRRRICRHMSRHADHSIASVQVAVFSSPSVVTNVTSIS